jgi:chemotaxis protein histidine kinase CheA
VNLTEFLSEFQLEAVEKLDLMGTQLLRLERDGANPQPVRELFLAAHTIKGGAAMLRLTDIEILAHGVEDLLSAFRDEQRELDSATADLLFQAIDHLRKLVASATAASAGAEPDPAVLDFAGQLRANAAGTPPVVASRDEASDHTPRALLVDASPTVRELHRMLLEDAGYHVESCDGGHLALSRALAEPFDLVISSVQTNGLSGFELTTALRAAPGYANAIVILTSADSDVQLTRRATECGARALVRKGSLHDERLSRVLAELGAHRAA